MAAAPPEPEPARLAIFGHELQLHGAVSLRITRPFFPWPPLADTVTDAAGRLLDGARGEQQIQAG